MSIYKTQGILIPQLRQLTDSRHASNNGYIYINKNKKNNTAVRKIKPEDIVQSFPMNGLPKKPFSRAGPCRIGMIQYCQRAKRLEDPTARYPVYPGTDKYPLSTYVTNWRWYVQPKKAPERKLTLNPRIRGVGMDGYLQSKNKSGLQEIQQAMREKSVPDPTEVTRGKDVYKE